MHRHPLLEARSALLGEHHRASPAEASAQTSSRGVLCSSLHPRTWLVSPGLGRGSCRVCGHTDTSFAFAGSGTGFVEVVRFGLLSILSTVHFGYCCCPRVLCTTVRVRAVHKPSTELSICLANSVNYSKNLRS